MFCFSFSSAPIKTSAITVPLCIDSAPEEEKKGNLNSRNILLLITRLSDFYFLPSLAPL